MKEIDIVETSSEIDGITACINDFKKEKQKIKVYELLFVTKLECEVITLSNIINILNKTYSYEVLNNISDIQNDVITSTLNSLNTVIRIDSFKYDLEELIILADNNDKDAKEFINTAISYFATLEYKLKNIGKDSEDLNYSIAFYRPVIIIDSKYINNISVIENDVFTIMEENKMFGEFIIYTPQYKRLVINLYNVTDIKNNI